MTTCVRSRGSTACYASTVGEVPPMQSMVVAITRMAHTVDVRMATACTLLISSVLISSVGELQ
jgi:hypothetical protein